MNNGNILTDKLRLTIKGSLLLERYEINQMFFIKRWFYRKRLRAIEKLLSMLDGQDFYVSVNGDNFVKCHEYRLAQDAKLYEEMMKKYH